MIEDPDQRKRIVSSIHDTSHMGLNRTTDIVSGKYYWPGLTSDVKAYGPQFGGSPFSHDTGTFTRSRRLSGRNVYASVFFPAERIR